MFKPKIIYFLYFKQKINERQNFAKIPPFFLPFLVWTSINENFITFKINYFSIFLLVLSTISPFGSFLHICIHLKSFLFFHPLVIFSPFQSEFCPPTETNLVKVTSDPCLAKSIPSQNSPLTQFIIVFWILPNDVPDQDLFIF